MVNLHGESPWQVSLLDLSPWSISLYLMVKSPLHHINQLCAWEYYNWEIDKQNAYHRKHFFLPWWFLGPLSVANKTQLSDSEIMLLLQRLQTHYHLITSKWDCMCNKGFWDIVIRIMEIQLIVQRNDRLIILHMGKTMSSGMLSETLQASTGCS